MTILFRDLGRMGYAAAYALQRQTLGEVAGGLRGDTLHFVEHDPVITLGRRARAEHVLGTPEDLARLGVEVVETDRGGDVTFHGPGQLVAYPIFQLRRVATSAKAYVEKLEEAMIRICETYGIPASRVPGRTGAWVGREKIGAIGVRLERWVTLHGFAFNVSTDLDFFRWIVPCGIADAGVTSLSALLGRRVPLEEVKARALEAFEIVFDRPVVPECAEVMR